MLILQALEMPDLATHFFALAFSAFGVNAYSGRPKCENIASLLALLLEMIFQYGFYHLLHLVDGS